MNRNKKNSLYAIIIIPLKEKRKKIISGEVTAFIREGYRSYRTGTVILCCHVDQWVIMVDIIKVKYCDFLALDEIDFINAGYKSQKDALIKIKKFYPNFSENSKITMIVWKNARKKLCK